MILLIGGCGYIGSRLHTHLSQLHSVHSVDILRRGNPSNIQNRLMDYASIPEWLIQQYDTIVLLAAHSSVGNAQSEPARAFYNNVVAFHRLLEMLGPLQRLVYASSSSVYSGFGASTASEDMMTGNMYDFSKLADDMLSSMSGKRCYGLRFGTVCGVSPNMRNDLMLCKMVASAVHDGHVCISNPKVRRPVLGMNDLIRAVAAVIDHNGAPGIYNLASTNSTVANYGAIVAAELDVPLVLGESTPTYDFSISSDKFCNEYNFTFKETASSIVTELARAYGGNGRSDDAVYADEALSGV